MRTDRLDCGWCGSARSIEYGICQVCLMEYSTETQIIKLPLDRAEGRRTIALEDEVTAAEK